jgi:hypothetical protein
MSFRDIEEETLTEAVESNEKVESGSQILTRELLSNGFLIRPKKVSNHKQIRYHSSM